MTKIFNACLVLVILLLLQRLEAQSTPPAQTGGAPATTEQKPADDPLGRGTPRGTMAGLIAAAEHGDLDRAGEYLESGLAPAARRELARMLWVVLDRRLATLPDRLSDEPGGDPGDGFSTRDRAGVVASSAGDVEIALQRVTRSRGSQVWLFASSTLEEIPRLYEEIQPPRIEQYVPAWLRRLGWLSIPLYRWIALLLIIPLILSVAALSTRILAVWVTRWFPYLSRHSAEHRLMSAGPWRLLMVALFVYSGSFFGFSLATRLFWHRVAVILAVIGVCWLALRVEDAVAALSLARLHRVHRSGDTALVRLLARLSKAATVLVAVLVVLYLADVDLTAALTGLGVGGIAIGFGAQKTIENLFGGIMVISDKPVNVGDVCKVGEFVGTVEDIGIRSTRIRTVDRTVVSVPNGQLASMILENYALRDRMRFQHTIGLAGPTTADQLRDVLDQIRQLLEAHPKVESASARTRLIRLTGVSLDIEVFAYVFESEQPAFLAVQEHLLLGIIDIVDASGASFAVPIITPSVAPGRAPGGGA